MNEVRRKTEEIREKTEVLVIGGGPAGVCAAIAAAREGAGVILLHNRPVLGGNSSSEIRVWTRGAVGGGNLFAEEMGIWGEMKLKNLRANPEGNPIFWDDILLDAVVSEPNIRLYLNTHAYSVLLEADQVKAVQAIQLGTEKELNIETKVLIDASGDGTFGALSGIRFMRGKEAASVYQERLAPKEAETGTLGSTLFFFTMKTGHPVSYIAPSFALPMDQIESLIDRGGRIVNEKLNGCDYWWFEFGGELDTIADNQEIAFSLKQLSLGVWNYIKNSGKFHADELTLSWEGNWIGKRESRRMETAGVLTERDVLLQTREKDAAFYGGWYMDFHPSGGVYANEDFCTQIPVGVYPIPFGTLYSEKIGNLLFAGRDIGVSHVAFASTRIMNTCALSGQAAGTLAAYMHRASASAAETVKEQRLELQERLYENDMFLPGFQSRKRTLSEIAEISVSSREQEGNEADRCGTSVLTDETVLIMPGEAAETEFLICSDIDCELSFEYECSRLPQRYDNRTQTEALLGSETVLPWQKKRGRTCVRLKKGEHFTRLLPEGAAVGEKEFCLLRFSLEPRQKGKIHAVVSSRQLCGFLLADTGTAQLTYPCIRLAPSASELYGAKALSDGFHRPYGSPNIWISRKEETPSIRIRFRKPEPVSMVELYLNPDLSRELCSSRAETWSGHHKFDARTSMPPELSRSIEVWGKNGTELLASIGDNVERHVRLSFPAHREEILEIRFTGDYGAGCAQVFEVNVK